MTGSIIYSSGKHLDFAAISFEKLKDLDLCIAINQSSPNINTKISKNQYERGPLILLCFLSETFCGTPCKYLSAI